MAIPEVTLSTADNVQFRFIFQSYGLFTASLISSYGSGGFTIASDTARIYSSSSSRFEIFFEKAIFEFPHTELKKFEAFLAEAQAAKEAA